MSSSSSLLSSSRTFQPRSRCTPPRCHLRPSETCRRRTLSTSRHSRRYIQHYTNKQQRPCSRPAHTHSKDKTGKSTKHLHRQQSSTSQLYSPCTQHSQHSSCTCRRRTLCMQRQVPCSLQDSQKSTPCCLLVRSPPQHTTCTHWRRFVTPRRSPPRSRCKSHSHCTYPQHIEQHKSSRPDLECQYQPDTLCTKSLQRHSLCAKDISGTFPNGLRH